MTFKVEVMTGGLLDTFTAVTEKTDSAVAKAVFDTGALLLTNIRRRASTGHHKPGLPHIPGTGPGPNQGTGDYVRSMHLTTGYEGANPAALVSSPSPQARMLEYGGTQTIVIKGTARTFVYPPYPHWRPAAEEIGPVLNRAVAEAVRKALP